MLSLRGHQRNPLVILNLKDLEAFRLAAERWRETAAETRDEEEWRRAKRYTRIAHQLTQFYTRRVFT